MIRGLRTRLAAPVRSMPRTSGAVVACGAAGLVLGTGAVPVPCPFLLITGLDCPFCGGSRVIGALLRADLAAALDSNAFALLVVLPLVVVALAVLGARELGRLPRLWPTGVRGTVLTAVLVTAALAWTVLRNLPFEPFSSLRA